MNAEAKWTYNDGEKWTWRGHTIWAERAMPPTLDEYLNTPTVYAWREPGGLYREIQEFASLQEAMNAAEAWENER